MAPSRKPPGPGGIKQNYPWGPDPRDQFLAFIANAEFYGMPVAFLRAVGQGYTFSLTASAGPLSSVHANVWTNSLYMHKVTYDTLTRIDVEDPPGASTALLDVYHESTHAYVDLKENEPKFKKFIADGIAYYKDAPMEGGGKCSDPDRVFQEAIASYVADRVAGWWGCLNVLTWLALKKPADQSVRDGLKRLALKQPKRYDDSMAERVYGYQEKSIVNSDQIATTKPISEAMKNFLDHEFLEDKIPDHFQSVARFRDLLLAFA
jgi:hypothetical protein